MVHVLAYRGLPMAVSLGIWVFTALLAGEAAFEQMPRPYVDGFFALLLRARFISYFLLVIWCVVLHVMSFSEIQELATRKAFGVWVVGQLIGLLAALFFTVLIATLFPNP